jgi:hypothetical protein
MKKPTPAFVPTCASLSTEMLTAIDGGGEADGISKDPTRPELTDQQREDAAKELLRRLRGGL